MPGVAAALGNDVDDRTGAATILRLEIGGHAHLSDGFHRKNGGGGAKHAGLVDGWIVAIAVVHVGAIEEEVVGAAAGSVDGKGAVGAGRIGNFIWGACDAGKQKDQFLIIAAINREVGG